MNIETLSMHVQLVEEINLSFPGRLFQKLRGRVRHSSPGWTYYHLCGHGWKVSVSNPWPQKDLLSKVRLAFQIWTPHTYLLSGRRWWLADIQLLLWSQA